MHYSKDMLNIIQMGKGDKLYHYTTSDALINIVINKEFWTTKWDYLNDIDELKVAEEVCEAILIEENIDFNIINAIKKELYKIIHENIQYFILSLSCDEDSQLLWSNYADFNGINLEVDFAKFEERLTNIIRWHGLVNYNLESQKKCMRKTFYDELINIEDFGNIKSLKDINTLNVKEYNKVVTHISIICALYSMFFKRESFKGEHEYRFVFTNLKENEINFRSKHGLIIPYIKNNVKDLDFINKITIGPINKFDIAENGIKELLHHNNINIDISKSEIPLRF